MPRSRAPASNRFHAISTHRKSFIFGGMPARAAWTAVLLVHAAEAGHDIMAAPTVSDGECADAHAELLVETARRAVRAHPRANIKRWTVDSRFHAPLDASKRSQGRRSIESGEAITVRYAPGSITDNSGLRTSTCSTRWP